MAKRVGDCSRKRRFSKNPAKAAYYAWFRSARLATRMLGADIEPPPVAKLARAGENGNRVWTGLADGEVTLQRMSNSSTENAMPSERAASVAGGKEKRQMMVNDLVETYWRDVMTFFDKKGVQGLEQDDLRGVWKKCLWLYKRAGLWRAGAEDLFLETLRKVGGLPPGAWPPAGRRKAWLKKVAQNLFLDQVKMTKRRHTREREYAARREIKRVKQRGVRRKRSYEDAEAPPHRPADAPPILRAVGRALEEQCTPKMRRVAELKAEKFPYCDIAEALTKEFNTWVDVAQVRRIWRHVKKIILAAVANYAA